MDYATMLRTIEFVDPCADNGKNPPIDVPTLIRFNGVPVARRTHYPTCAAQVIDNVTGGLRIRLDEPVAVALAGDFGQSETLVSFVIHEGDLRMPNYGRTYGPTTCPLIRFHGRDTSKANAYEWEDISDCPEGLTIEPMIPHENSGYVWEYLDPDKPWVRVWIQTRARFGSGV